MSKNDKNDLLVKDVIRRNIEKRKSIIKNVINFRDRIPLVEYKKEGNDMFICSKYHFIDDIYIKVKWENHKIKLSFMDGNTPNLFKSKQDTEKVELMEEMEGDRVKDEIPNEMLDTVLDNEMMNAEVDMDMIKTEEDIELGKTEVDIEMVRADVDIEVANEEMDRDIENRELDIWVPSRRGKKNHIIILSGTSGGGKSTLSCLLGLFLNIRRILSTDMVREILRKYHIENGRYLKFSTYESWKLSNSDEEQNETYTQLSEHRGCKEKENRRDSNGIGADIRGDKVLNSTWGNRWIETGEGVDSMLSKRCVENYSKQCELLFNYIDDIIKDHIVNKKSIIIEGVHINSNMINKLITKYPNKIIFFLVYINDRETSIRRFSSRSTDSNEEENKYIKNINYISDIQKCLLETTRNLFPPINYIENIDIFNSLERALNIIYSFA
ncbi:conserved Plasmodium protein, unknown function [Plasmodium ovale curtisi]|uniref:Uncharacterized protein n=1 Tax=Plasmodium ovale curtisi TaxID=864141 RepID=A0A1A8X2I3_PLAOA|nr:conserved Plasmodium protein, unknown function [Plasmodium ovale curtisi]SBS97943.1 conserved Plasmodium protein, unknown function [Plasmodium ovale curtisi]